MSDHGGTEIRGGASPATAGFAIGTQVGSYRIDARLGEGGMGVVYRATDTKLNREVAIKVLGDHLFDANARRRFQREAQMASALNHPHILTVYDVGEHADRQYLVTELVDGGTLQDWAHAEPHRWRAIIELMIGVADALAAAHDASILHRDVKPANILITKNGYAKLADFGLAKLVEDDEARARGTRHTATGAVVGTAAYMSPEQALGRKLDARSDVFTFGVVLYELLAGRHPFAGESDVVMLQAVIHAQPPPLPDEIPEALKSVVEKTLEKDPADRYQTMRDLVVDLRRIARRSSASLPQAKPAPRRTTAWLAWGIAAAAVGALAVVGVGTLRRGAVAPTEPSEFAILAPDDTTFDERSVNTVLTAPTLSSDGRRLAFAATGKDGVTRLWLRELSSLAARPLNGTEDAEAPFWSPDGRSLGFFSGGKLRRIDIAGGPAQALADAPLHIGATWAPDGTIVYCAGPGPLFRVPATGGTAMPLTRLDPGLIGDVFPQMLPDGRHVVFVAARTPSDGDLAVASLDSAEATTSIPHSGVVPNGLVGYAAPGYLLLLREGVLLAQPFDAARLALRGDPVAIANDVNSASAAQNGTLVYRRGQVRGLTEIEWRDRNGASLETVAPAGLYRAVALSPDGTRLAFDTLGAPAWPDVWIIELQRGVTSRFTFGPTGSLRPVWSPDGRTIAFNSGEPGAGNIYRRAANSASSAERLLELHANGGPTDWSPDGRFLAYDRLDPKTANDVWVLPLEGGAEPRALLHEPYNESQTQFSPDGRWIAYVSDESGVPQVYVQSFPELTGKWQISTRGGSQPRWARAGKELFYLALDRKLVAVSYESADTFEIGKTEVLFETKLPPAADHHTYAVATDGRFLLDTPVAEASVPLTLVLNWPALLRK
jgi:serine/threonine protein kinase/Tol biopolymer transport system component